VTLRITPIDGGRPTVFLDKFLTYEFSSNLLVPVDSFSFTYVAPESDTPVSDQIKEGDVITLYANNLAISTGIIDQVDIEVDAIIALGSKSSSSSSSTAPPPPPH
jgi:prophage tail gpP-like protein